MARGKPKARQPEMCMAEVFDECQRAATCHPRHVSSLLKLVEADGEGIFIDEFRVHLAFILTTKSKGRPVDLCLQFARLFLVKIPDASISEPVALLEEILLELASWCEASDKLTRQRVATLLSQVILALPAELQLTADACTALRAAFHGRLQDKVAAVRAAAARALERFILIEEDGDVSRDPTVSLLRSCLRQESSADVREGILSALPESSDTLNTILEQTGDCSESVRMAAYHILASKFFPLEGFSIRQRTEALERGLSDDSLGVRKSCCQLLQEIWLKRDCQGDLVRLLSLLDVEHHEEVGQLVMKELSASDALKEILGSGASLRDFIGDPDSTEPHAGIDHLLKPEEAFFWKWICVNLAQQATDLGSAAASAVGANAAVAADTAGSKFKNLDELMPASVEDYVALVDAHIRAGLEHRFAARQLLGLAKVLDFTDASARTAAVGLVRSQLLWGYSYREDSAMALQDQEAEAMEVSLGGSHAWAQAVAELAAEVYRGNSDQLHHELIEALAKVGLACREGTGTPGQWLHCLAIGGMALASLTNLGAWRGFAMEPQEVLNCLVLPGVSHRSTLVRKAAMECLGAFCTMSRDAAAAHAPMLLSAFRHDTAELVRVAALKAILDIALLYSLPQMSGASLGPPTTAEPILDTSLCLNILLEILPCPGKPAGDNSFALDEEAETAREQEGLVALACEGLAKMLLWEPQRERGSEALAALLNAYFCPALEEHWWSRQALMAFFQAFAALPTGKALLTGLYVPLVRNLWPKASREYLTAKGETAARQRASALSQLVLCLVKQETFEGEVGQEGRQDDAEESTEAKAGEGGGTARRQGAEGSTVTNLEKLAFDIGVEMLTCPFAHKPSGKLYLNHLARSLASLPMASPAEARPLLVLAPRLLPLVQHNKAAQKDVNCFTARLCSLLGADPDTIGESDDYQELLRTVDELIDAARAAEAAAGKAVEDDDKENMSTISKEGLERSGSPAPLARRPRAGKAVGAARRRRVVLDEGSGEEQEEEEEEPRRGLRRRQTTSTASGAGAATPPSTLRPSRQSKSVASSRLKAQLRTVVPDEDSGGTGDEDESGETEDSGSSVESEDTSGGGSGLGGEKGSQGGLRPRSSASPGSSSDAPHHGRMGKGDAGLSSESGFESAAGTSPASLTSPSSHQPGGTGKTGLGWRARQEPALASPLGNSSEQGVAGSPSMQAADSSAMFSAESEMGTASSASPVDGRTVSLQSSEPSPVVKSVRTRGRRPGGQRKVVIDASSEDGGEGYQSGED